MESNEGWVLTKIFLEWLKYWYTIPSRWARMWEHGSLAKYEKLRVVYAPGVQGTFSSPLRASDPDIHHGTCLTYVPWCMVGWLTSGFLWIGGVKNGPGIPGACATHNFTYLVRGQYNVYHQIWRNARETGRPVNEFNHAPAFYRARWLAKVTWHVYSTWRKKLATVISGRISG